MAKNGDYFCWKLPKHSTYHVPTKLIPSSSYIKSMLANATTKKLQQNKPKLYKNLKIMKLLKNCTKETSILPAIQGFKKFT